jgi:hypothetical protein
VRFRGPFEDQGNTLPHGIQQDSISCGLFCVNTITHNAFGDRLGIPNPAHTRAMWFKQIAHEHINAVSQEISNVSTSDTVVGPPPPPSTTPDGPPPCQTETNERKQRLIKTYKDKADLRAVEVARVKKEKEIDRQKELEIERQKQLEIERQKELEIKRQQALEIERQKELEIKRQQDLEIERQKQLEIKRQQDLEIERQKQLEIKRQKELEYQRLEKQRLEWELQRAASGSGMKHTVTDDRMDVDNEPGEVIPESNALSPTKVKADIVNRRDPSPRPCAPFVPNRSRRSLSPPPRGSSYYPSRREMSSRHRPSSYRDYPPSQSDRHAPARRYRSRSPSQERFTRRGRFPLPDRARGSNRQPTRHHSPVRRSYRSTFAFPENRQPIISNFLFITAPSPHRRPPTNRCREWILSSF